MARLRKNLILVAMAIASCISNGPRPAMAANSDIMAVQGGGVFNNVDVFRIDSSGNVTISTYNVSGVAQPHTTFSVTGAVTHGGNVTISSPFDFYYGSSATSVSTTTTSGSSQGPIFTATLLPGSLSPAAVEGSVICATGTTGTALNVVVCPATLNLQTFVGVAVTAASTGSVVNVYTAGAWALALGTGTITAGDQLVTSNLGAGYLQTATTAINTSTNTIAIALSGSTTGLPGLVKVRLR